MQTVKDKKALVETLRRDLAGYSTLQLLGYFLDNFRDRIVLASSMAAEDQVLTDMVCKTHPATRIITLDTGRLPQETYDVIEKTRKHYNVEIEVLFPDYRQVQKMVDEQGPNLFYKSVQNRELCCHIRKIEPLKRALQGMDVWICGVRKEQSVTRAGLESIAWDEQFGLIKLSPLLNWTTGEIWDYIRQNNVPYNALHDKGYPSIGCAPCTRAVQEGEDIRAGRWWWEQPEHKECGLHWNQTGDKK